MDYSAKFGQFISCFTTIILLFSQCQVSSSQTLDIGPQNKTVKLGSNVVLECLFQTPVWCMWSNVNGHLRQFGPRHFFFQNNGTVKFAERYHYIKYNSTMKNAERYRFIKYNGTRDAMDCSIEIINVQESDLGPWRCTTFRVTPVIAWLSEQKTPSKPKIFLMGKELTEIVLPLMNNQTTATNLSCVSEEGNPPPKLSWELDGQTIPGNTQNMTITEDKLFSTYLSWSQEDWSNFDHNKGPLKCILEHPGYEQPQVATVNLVQEYATNIAQIRADGIPGNIFELAYIKQLVFRCIHDGQPKPSIIWQFLPEGETEWIVTQNGGDSLVVTEPKDGRYRCNAGNRLNIQGRPVVSQEFVVKGRDFETSVINHYAILIIFIGALLLLVIIQSIMLVCCYCRKKDKSKTISESSAVATFTSQRQSDPDPDPEVHIYNDIITETQKLEEDSDGYLLPAAVNPLLHFYDNIRT